MVDAAGPFPVGAGDRAGACTESTDRHPTRLLYIDAMGRKPRGRVLLAVATTIGAVTLVSCGRSEANDPPSTLAVSTTSTPTTSTPTTSTPTTAPTTSTPITYPVAPTTTAPVDPADTALAFFRSTEAACRAHASRTGNPPVPHSFFAGATAEGPAPGGGWIIRDGAGNRLVVDIADHVVYSTDGRDAVLPDKYSFGCPETLYLGSAAD